VNTCTLSRYYVEGDGKEADEARVAEEINCIEVNANDARECGRLHAECSGELERRAR
jgi:hypothetical protein